MNSKTPGAFQYIGWISRIGSIRRSVLFVMLGASLLQLPLANGQTSILTWHYDNARSGINPNETLLTPANVVSTKFGKLFAQSVDGYVVGQALYVPGLNIAAKGVHNVVFVATMHDSVYAFDADNANGANAAPLWTTSLLNYSPPGATPAPISIVGCGGVTAWTEVGVISTPVIDPVTQTMYVVAETLENFNLVHRLHALDITTGVEKLSGPVTLSAAFTSSAGTSTFQSANHINRPGLLLVNGHIYIAFGSAGCNNGNQGWVLSYNASNLQQEGAFSTEPGGFYASIWQKGAGLSSDAAGDVYAETGEGQNVPGTNFGMSILKLSQVGTKLGVTDWFTPYNWQFLNQGDYDLHNAVLILPDQPGAHPHEAIAVGKEGRVYVLDRDNLGHLCSACTMRDTQIVQEMLIAPRTGTPIFWNNRVYFTPTASPVKAYSLQNGLLVTPLAAQSIKMTGAGHPIITSNGNTNGVFWMISGGVLWALDANTLKVLYTSAQAANARDQLPGLAHFATPISADGKVFIGTKTGVVAYGLLPSLVATGGNNQTGTVATTLPVALSVQLTDPYSGVAIPGATVGFSDGGKGGTFSNGTAMTDSTGSTFTSYTLPTKAATYTLTATATSYGSFSFSETASPGPAASLARLSGNLQTASVNTTLLNPLVAVVRDQYTNFVPGVSVSFADSGAGGVFSSNPVLTNNKGQAIVSYTSSTTAGTVTIKATTAGVPALKFTENITAGPASSIKITSGNNQTGPPATLLPNPLVISVNDQYGNPVSGAAVNFSDAGAGGTFSVNPATTLANGTASVSYTTSSTSGSVTVSATVSGVANPALFTLTVQ
jgi:Bacterial Ig-like domain (group 1)/Invasin, domain 3